MSVVNFDWTMLTSKYLNIKDIVSNSYGFDELKEFL